MFLNTVKRPDGSLVTGQSWRIHHPFFKQLPFYSGLANLNLDFIGEPLQQALALESPGNTYGNRLLVVCSDHIFLF